MQLQTIQERTPLFRSSTQVCASVCECVVVLTKLRQRQRKCSTYGKSGKAGKYGAGVASGSCEGAWPVGKRLWPKQFTCNFRISSFLISTFFSHFFSLLWNSGRKGRMPFKGFLLRLTSLLIFFIFYTEKWLTELCIFPRNMISEKFTHKKVSLLYDLFLSEF